MEARRWITFAVWQKEAKAQTLESTCDICAECGNIENICAEKADTLK